MFNITLTILSQFYLLVFVSMKGVMIMYKAYKFRLYPDNNQRELINKIVDLYITIIYHLIKKKVILVLILILMIM